VKKYWSIVLLCMQSAIGSEKIAKTSIKSVLHKSVPSVSIQMTETTGISLSKSVEIPILQPGKSNKMQSKSPEVQAKSPEDFSPGTYFTNYHTLNQFDTFSPCSPSRR
jgi:hypothetical protein